MTSLPLISVYIPTFNRENLLIRAVHSVLNQTYKNLEVLVVNDGDKFSEGTLVFFKSDPRIRLFSTKGQQGACVARNVAIDNALGKYITGLDDDDYFSNDRIEYFVKRFETSSASFLFSDIWVRKGGYIKKNSMPKSASSSDLIRGNLVGNQVFSLLSRFREVGGFDESLPAWQDFDLWLRLSHRFGAGENVGNASYVWDITGEDRISNSSFKVFSGYRCFLEKHRTLFCNEDDRICLYLSYARYSNVSFFDLDYRWILRDRGVRFFVIFLIKKIVIRSSVLRYMVTFCSWDRLEPIGEE